MRSGHERCREQNARQPILGTPTLGSRVAMLEHPPLALPLPPPLSLLPPPVARDAGLRTSQQPPLPPPPLLRMLPPQSPCKPPLACPLRLHPPSPASMRGTGRRTPVPRQWHSTSTALHPALSQCAAGAWYGPASARRQPRTAVATSAPVETVIGPRAAATIAAQNERAKPCAAQAAYHARQLPPPPRTSRCSRERDVPPVAPGPGSASGSLAAWATAWLPCWAEPRSSATRSGWVAANHPRVFHTSP